MRHERWAYTSDMDWIVVVLELGCILISREFPSQEECYVSLKIGHSMNLFVKSWKEESELPKMKLLTLTNANSQMFSISANDAFYIYFLWFMSKLLDYHDVDATLIIRARAVGRIYIALMLDCRAVEGCTGLRRLCIDDKNQDQKGNDGLLAVGRHYANLHFSEILFIEDYDVSNQGIEALGLACLNLVNIRVTK
uniref:Uncharacterized protein n=1 Tax=Tanacetum cinerariifolium TaxID=118510 RepID=A0A6L2P2F3_TANCI|nr:hypothetical protein [Tanacetum cinerariifolium]